MGYDKEVEMIRIKGGSHNNQQVEDDAWVKNEDGRGRVSRIKL